ALGVAVDPPDGAVVVADPAEALEPAGPPDLVEIAGVAMDDDAEQLRGDPHLGVDHGLGVAVADDVGIGADRAHGRMPDLVAVATRRWRRLEAGAARRGRGKR